jgi:hypothetical protein
MKFVHGFEVEVETKAKFRNCLPPYQEAVGSLTMPLLRNYLISGFRASVGAVGVQWVQPTSSQQVFIIHWDIVGTQSTPVVTAFGSRSPFIA